MDRSVSGYIIPTVISSILFCVGVVSDEQGEANLLALSLFYLLLITRRPGKQKRHRYRTYSADIIYFILIFVLVNQTSNHKIFSQG
ncbi:hypothetical protein ASPSYDRAFT_42269, partial [Aspergillus sydowii CBS 593.65]